MRVTLDGSGVGREVGERWSLSGCVVSIVLPAWW